MDLYMNEDSQELLQSLDRALPHIEYALNKWENAIIPIIL